MNQISWCRGDGAEFKGARTWIITLPLMKKVLETITKILRGLLMRKGAVHPTAGHRFRAEDGHQAGICVDGEEEKYQDEKERRESAPHLPIRHRTLSGHFRCGVKINHRVV